MDKTDITDEEFREKIQNVALDYLADGGSYRKVAPKYGVSYVSISNWLALYLPQIDQELYEAVKIMRDERKEKTVNNDPTVRDRVSKAAALILSEGLTVRQIAERLGTTEWVIYIDLVRRLPLLQEVDESICDRVKETLKQHSIDNNRRGNRRA